MNDTARLSKLLFEAREQIAMWADVVEARSGNSNTEAHRTRDRIDSYRAEHGWSTHGYGGEE